LLTIWGQWQHVLRMVCPVGCVTLRALVRSLLLAGHTVCSIRSIERSLDHWWQLQLLVVRIVTLLSCVSLSVTDLFHLDLAISGLVLRSIGISLLLPRMHLALNS
jgi:hypothetical protein